MRLVFLSGCASILQFYSRGTIIQNGLTKSCLKPRNGFSNCPHQKPYQIQTFFIRYLLKYLFRIGRWNCHDRLIVWVILIWLSYSLGYRYFRFGYTVIYRYICKNNLLNALPIYLNIISFCLIMPLYCLTYRFPEYRLSRLLYRYFFRQFRITET